MRMLEAFEDHLWIPSSCSYQAPHSTTLDRPPSEESHHSNLTIVPLILIDRPPNRSASTFQMHSKNSVKRLPIQETSRISNYLSKQWLNDSSTTSVTTESVKRRGCENRMERMHFTGMTAESFNLMLIFVHFGLRPFPFHLLHFTDNIYSSNL